MEILTFKKGTPYKNSWEFNQLKDKAICSVVVFLWIGWSFAYMHAKLFYYVSLIIFKSNLQTHKGVTAQNVSAYLPLICTDT